MEIESKGRNAAAIGLIGLGVLFLVGQYVRLDILGTFWPAFVIVPGLAFLFPAVTGDQSKAALAIPGAMITGTGGILLYQSLTNHWESWAYVWSLYPVFLGAALVFVGRRTGDRGKISVGDGFLKWGLMAFIGLWLFFEILIFGGNSQLVSTLVPLALIGAGIFMLTRRNFARSAPRKAKSMNGRRSYSEELQEEIDAALSGDEDIIV